MEKHTQKDKRVYPPLAGFYFCHALPIVPDVSDLLEGAPLSKSYYI